MFLRGMRRFLERLIKEYGDDDVALLYEVLISYGFDPCEVAERFDLEELLEYCEEIDEREVKRDIELDIS